MTLPTDSLLGLLNGREWDWRYRWFSTWDGVSRDILLEEKENESDMGVSGRTEDVLTSWDYWRWAEGEDAGINGKDRLASGTL